MKIAFVASENVIVNSEDAKHYARFADEIILNDASCIDFYTAEHIKREGVKITEFTPDYEKYGKAAPKKIVDLAERVIVFFDGASAQTRAVIEYATEQGKPPEIVFYPLVLKLRF